MAAKRAKKGRGGCRATSASGTPCRAFAPPGLEFCRWHDPAPTARAAHRASSQKGGTAKAYGALPHVASLLELEPRLADVDPGTALGIRDTLAAALRALSRLPFDVRVGNSLAQLATSARAIIETADLEARIRALEEREAQEAQEAREEATPV